MNPTSFVHLKSHSEYSIRDGIIRISDLIQQAKSDGMTAVAISDHCNLFALVKFYSKALSSGIKPIVAADLWLYEGNEKFRFTCYCLNKKGYLNLTRLISKSYTEGQIDDLPTVRWEWLQEWHEGLLILSGGQAGDVGQALLSHKKDQVDQRIKRWLATFPNRYYIELQRTQRDGEERYIESAVQLALAYQVPVVATNDVCFMSPDDFEAHEARVCIHSGYVLNDPKRPRSYSKDQYFRTQEEMITLFADIPEAIQNTVEIAKRCTVALSLGTPYLPNFPVPENITLKDYLKNVSLEGLEACFSKQIHIDDKKKTVYYDRLDVELDVINKMGFPGYFLIVADFIGWAKRQDIPVGPGRGSGAGSLVAFCLGITELDPILHDLLFERFLNPERVSMPDFDIDFCMERRDEVIDYVAQRYGRESVSQIITYGTMAAKAVVRDVGRVLGIPYGFVDRIAKLIPFEVGITLQKAMDQEEQLAELYQDEDDVKTLIDLAMKLEGITRNAGKHAGGVVIAPTKLTDFSPLYCESNGANVVTQFDKDDVEAVGLVKFDFLGLRTLTIIHWALSAVNQKRHALGEGKVDISQIPLDDEKTFELLKSCATTAVFQLESRGMKELVRRLQPDDFEDITALVALFRPGPLQSGMVDDYIDRKHGRASVRYSHPDLEPILSTTNGVILYQEQVMEIARKLAGYSLGGADILRRAMGKKKPEEMAKQREVFASGAEQRGVSRDISEHVFDVIEKFAGYGFNKSHSAAYALISYQTAWLKTHYPAEFMAAVLSSDMDNTDKVVVFLKECAGMKLTVCPPEINLGEYAFKVNEAGDIQYGLGAIKGVGEAAVLNIAEERAANGPYRDLFDFCRRIDSHKVNKRALEPLIASGAMDVFERSRAILMASSVKAMKAAEQHARDQAVGQVDLFGTMDAVAQDSVLPYIIVEDWTTERRLKHEKSTLGYYASGHPMLAYESELSSFVSTAISDLDKALRKEVVIAGMITNVRVLNTKRGRRLAIVMLEDCSGEAEVTLFSKLYDEVARELQNDQIVVLRGKVEDDTYSGGVRIIAETCETLDQARTRLAKRLLLQAHDQDQVDRILKSLPAIMAPYRGGSCPVTIAYQSEAASADLQLGKSWHIRPNDDLLLQLKQLCGETAVALEY
jgi:DNA polymerase III subunit alpha